jgi:uncharacterized membrane protein YhiD involved in acid resistance
MSSENPNTSLLSSVFVGLRVLAAVALFIAFLVAGVIFNFNHVRLVLNLT